MARSGKTPGLAIVPFGGMSPPARKSEMLRPGAAFEQGREARWRSLHAAFASAAVAINGKISDGGFLFEIATRNPSSFPADEPFVIVLRYGSSALVTIQCNPLGGQFSFHQETPPLIPELAFLFHQSFAFPDDNHAFANQFLREVLGAV